MGASEARPRGSRTRRFTAGKAALTALTLAAMVTAMAGPAAAADKSPKPAAAKPAKKADPKKADPKNSSSDPSTTAPGNDPSAAAPAAGGNSAANNGGSGAGNTVSTNDPAPQASAPAVSQAGQVSAQAKAAPNAAGCSEDSFLGTQFPAAGTTLHVGDQFGAIFHDETPLNQGAVVFNVKDAAGHVVPGISAQFGAAAVPKGDKFATKIFAVVPSNLASGTYTAHLHAEDTDQNKAGGDCGEADWTIVVDNNHTPVLDLSITKTASPTHVQRKGTVVYTLNVTNSGPDTDTGVVISDPLPADEAFVSASGAPCSANAGVVTCSIGTLGAGQSATVLLTTTAPSTDGTFPNTATVHGDITETNMNNNQATATIVVSTTPPPGPQVDLAIVKTASATSVNVNDNLVYTLTATNNGPDTATNVTVTDELPSGIVGTGATASQGTCDLSGQSVSCSLGTMAKGDSVVIHVTTTATAAGNVTNCAHVSGSEPETNLANNDSCVTTPVQNVQGVQVVRVAVPASSLPFTGSESGLMILLALGLLSAGSGWFILGQRKRGDASAE